MTAQMKPHSNPESTDTAAASALGSKVIVRARVVGTVLMLARLILKIALAIGAVLALVD